MIMETIVLHHHDGFVCEIKFTYLREGRVKVFLGFSVYQLSFSSLCRGELLVFGVVFALSVLFCSAFFFFKSSLIIQWAHCSWIYTRNVQKYHRKKLKEVNSLSPDRYVQKFLHVQEKNCQHSQHTSQKYIMYCYHASL